MVADKKYGMAEANEHAKDFKWTQEQLDADLEAY